ncbi:Ankyrin repeat-containing protein P1E11.10 [Drechmeria coniospora]|uniref:Ankyrin repeat-containing protein P1E11.10 n=1 Tax=Drechmeria coniospora TaxID=98403 RepID=A0A151GFS6_DRECN|nr:Ankyrin repeat-containing protein P1E11.10 [Drechmeria coniospora]KYK55934.1 Ankyrin repeat-containing protein P1E11.10 [Drechmeria coniospora]ODA76653.1 hypothetical protein RJ55_07924 [Drechmeria coniospora]
MAETPNPFLLAADNSPALLPFLRENLQLASAQDEHGYSLLHAAASYNHLDLLQILVREFHVDINLKDEDDETALFVVETPEAAKVLVEELSIDVGHRSSEGLTAREKVEADGDFPAVASYLASVECIKSDNHVQSVGASHVPDAINALPSSKAIKFTVGTVDQGDDDIKEVDTEFRQRIEEFARRDDFASESGQADLRKLVEAIMGPTRGDGC